MLRVVCYNPNSATAEATSSAKSEAEKRERGILKKLRQALAVQQEHARILRRGGSYVVEALSGALLRVNGQPTVSRALSNGDTLQVGVERTGEPATTLAVVLEDKDLKLERLREESFWGTPDIVAAKLKALAAELQVEDVVVLSTAHDPEARRRSYTLLAQEFKMSETRALAAE